MVNLFQAPVPGQSLTETPRNAPWERPSEFNTVEEAVKHYVGILADQEVMDDVATAFQLGADLKTLTETMMLTGSMKGLHTVETGMLAGPVVASFIKAAMMSYGIDTPETPISFEERATAKERDRLKMLLGQAVEEALAGGADEGDAGVSLLQETAQAAEEEAPAMEAEEEQPKPSMGKGLMARGGNV